MSEFKEYHREKFLAFIANVDQEILNMRSGEGRFRPGALHFEEGKASPVLHRLTQLKDNPSAANLAQFIEIAKQDFGAATATAFANWSRAIFPENPNVVKKHVPKAFDVAIKDGFYDLFKAAQIPLTPKQVELLEIHSLKLARTFDTKIQEVVRAQLTALVSKSKATEEASNV
jgi:hypothetical protein